MFNLFHSRQKLVRYLLGGLLVVVALSMVTYLIPGAGSTPTVGTSDDVLADIGNTHLTTTDVQRNIEAWVQGGRVPEAMVQVYVPQFIEQMLREKAAEYEFSRQGLTVSDDEVLVGMASQYAQFFQNGQLVSKDQLVAALAQRGQTLQDAIDEMRSELMLRKIQNMLYATTVVSPQEVTDALRLKAEKAKIKYIAFPPAKFRDGITATPEELQASFNTHKNDYVIPEKRSFQALVVDQAKVEATLTVSDAQLHEAYNSSLDNFRTPERVHVRHILLMTTNKTDAEKKEALTKAQDLLKQLKGGADFATLAKQNSQDPGSAQNGGDLGWVVRGQTVPEFEKAAFALKPNELSGIITTQYGYHIIQLLQKEEARLKPFEEVKDSLAQQIKSEGITDKMQSIADQARAALEKAPGSAADIAKQMNLDLVNVSEAKAGEPIPTLGVSPEIDMALTGMKKNDVSQVLVLPANRLVVVVLTDRIPARPAEFKEVENQVRERLISDKSIVAANKAAKEAADKLRAGANMDQLAKSMKLDVVESIDFTRADSVEGLGPSATIGDPFSKAVGAIVGPISVQNRDIVYQVLNKTTPDPSTFAAEREGALSELKQKKAVSENDLFLDSLVAGLTAQGKIKVHADAVKRLIASYR